eukprot:gene31376-41824_t
MRRRGFCSSTSSKWMGTIGIIGLNPLAIGSLNKGIVLYCNSIGMSDGQYFPEILTVGIKTTKKDRRYLQDQANLCYDFGCDLVATPHKTGISELLVKKISDEISAIPVFTLEQSIEELAKTVVDYAIESEKPRRKNIGIHGNLKYDQKYRLGRIADRKIFGKYPVLNNGFIGVVGGAASADFCFKLAKASTPFVHYCSANLGKQTGFGPSYTEHCKNAVKFFDSISATRIAIPCNMAGESLKECCEDSLTEIIDIRQCVLDEYRNAESFILLQTTTGGGVGSFLNDGEMETSENLCNENFIVPSSQDQEKIMTAINSVKAGKIDETKRIILDVVRRARKEHGDCMVILGCTELSSVFNDLELCYFKLIDPEESLADKCQKEIFKFQISLSDVNRL